jgi:hypothetical protein
MTRSRSITHLSRRLALNAEAVCRHYLPSGHKQGRYWLVGDVSNAPGRSLYIRLAGPDSGPGAAGKWTDAATGDHGDLLDLIRANRALADVHAAADEARRFLSLPQDTPKPATRTTEPRSAGAKRAAARRLWAMTRPLAGSHAGAYLATRAITDLRGTAALRFHPACFHRADDGTRQSFPALIAAVTDADFSLHGLHRTWLDPAEPLKAPLPEPRRAMGSLLGHGVRIGYDRNDHPEVLAVGEGIETMLSLRQALPHMPMIAALSAANLGSLALPSSLRRLYIATDTDRAARLGYERLALIARRTGIDTAPLRPVLGDFNDDLRQGGRQRLRLTLAAQLIAADVVRYVGDP